jgi:hypothetical protein
VKANGRIKPLHVLDVKSIEASERAEDDAAAMIPGRTWKGAR